MFKTLTFPFLIFILAPAFTLAAPMEIPAVSFVEPLVSMEFVMVQGGEFTGGDETGKGRQNERPPHRVHVTDFYMGIHEVTVVQFARFVEDTGYLSSSEKRGWVLDIDPDMGTFKQIKGISWKNPGFEQKGNHPVVWVDWHDATAYAAWLSEKTGETYTLPTEAQWEYAAKAGVSQRWSGTSTDEEITEFAWFSSNSRMTTHGTGLLKPNAFGIYDLSGNVWEWCLDGYYEYGKAPHALVDPIMKTGDTRIIRGGSWRVDAPLVTTTYRNGYKPTYSHSSIGFRLVKVAAGLE